MYDLIYFANDEDPSGDGGCCTSSCVAWHDNAGYRNPYQLTHHNRKLDSSPAKLSSVHGITVDMYKLGS